MKFNEYRELRETVDFNLKFNILLKQIVDSGLTFDEYWISHGLPRLIEGSYSNHNELLDRMMLQEVNWGSLPGKAMAGAGKGTQWLGDKMVGLGNKWQNPAAPQAQQAQQGTSPFADPTQNTVADTGNPYSQLAAGANKAMDIMARSQGGMGSEQPGAQEQQPGQQQQGQQQQGQQQQGQQGQGMEDILSQNFEKSMEDFLNMSKDPSVQPAAQSFWEKIKAAGTPIIKQLVASMANQPAQQTAGMGAQGPANTSNVAMGNYSGA